MATSPDQPTQPVARLRRSGPAICIMCGGSMPPIKPQGRIPIYCSTHCRKAAYEARREARPEAFEVKVIQTRTVADHPLNTCVDNAMGSPKAFRRMLTELARMLDHDQLTDPRWQPLETEITRLRNALWRRQQRQKQTQQAADIQRAQHSAAAQEQLRHREQQDLRRRYGLPDDFQL